VHPRFRIAFRKWIIFGDFLCCLVTIEMLWTDPPSQESYTLPQYGRGTTLIERAKTVFLHSRISSAFLNMIQGLRENEGANIPANFD
jgi:hypothetical protein